MIRDLLKRAGQKKAMILAMILAVGIMFVLLSEYIPTGASAKDASFDEAAYTESLERRLEEIISRVDGVSEVKVMVTLEGSQRYRYESGAVQSVMAASDGVSQNYRADKEGSDAVLTFVAMPEIKGVSVVCKGGANAAVRQKVIGLIAGALNLGVNRIYVTE